MTTFHKKADVANILIVFDAKDDTFSGPGYRHPQRVVEPLRGLDSYPPIFNYPGVCISDTSGRHGMQHNLKSPCREGGFQGSGQDVYNQ